VTRRALTVLALASVIILSEYEYRYANDHCVFIPTVHECEYSQKMFAQVLVGTSGENDLALG